MANIARNGLHVWLMLAVLALLGGCSNSSNPTIPDNGTERYFGPPYDEILFLDGDNFVGTVASEGGSDPVYLPGVGTGTAIPAPGFGVLRRPTSLASTPHFLVYDTNNNTLKLLDESGVAESAFDGARAVNHLYAFTPGGTRAAYVRTGETEGQQLLSEGVPGFAGGMDIYATLTGNERFDSRPSFNGSASAVVIAVLDPLNQANSRLAIYRSNGDLITERPGRVGAPQYSNSGQFIAFLDFSESMTQVSELVIYSQNMTTELERYTFNTYGTGAMSFAWSPDDSMIALYVNIYDDPTLIIIDRAAGGSINEVPLEQTIALGEGNDLYWAAPSWGSSNTLAVCVEEGEQYKIITTSLNGLTTDLVTGLSQPTAVIWHR